MNAKITEVDYVKHYKAVHSKDMKLSASKTGGGRRTNGQSSLSCSHTIPHFSAVNMK